MILSALTGKDARYIIELPGDFKHVRKFTEQEKKIIEQNIAHLCK